jgi:hypothetical protein
MQAHWPQAVGERDAETGEWRRPPSEKASELLLKIAERKSRLMGLDRQQAGIVGTVTAEQIAAYLGWDPQESERDVGVERVDVRGA